MREASSVADPLWVGLPENVWGRHLCVRRQVWKQPNGDARIVMYSDDKRVKVIGRPNQVRSLVVIVAPFTEAQPGLGQQVRALAAAPQTPDGRVPSEAYAPAEGGGNCETGADVNNDGIPIVSSDAANGRNQSLAGQTRLARQDFEPQGQGELALTEGEFVCITHDPEGEHGSNQDRWVYGRSEAGGQLGWFPLSHTVLLEERHDL